MQTKTITPNEAIALARKENNDEDNLFEEINKILVIAIKEKRKEVTLQCYDRQHTDEYEVFCDIESHKQVGCTKKFDRIAIKKAIEHYKKAGWRIITKKYFSKYGDGAYVIRLP